MCTSSGPCILFQNSYRNIFIKKNNLKTGGKFQDDFRVTDWGKFMRATWLDELPMIYNWLKGDLKLFGVRPLSHQYLSLYTDELRKLRTTVLPGLIPPFYADIPKTLPEICASEKRYLRAYLESPVKTQWIYFWKVFYPVPFFAEDERSEFNQGNKPNELNKPNKLHNLNKLSAPAIEIKHPPPPPPPPPPSLPPLLLSLL